MPRPRPSPAPSGTAEAPFSIAASSSFASLPCQREGDRRTPVEGFSPPTPPLLPDSLLHSAINGLTDGGKILIHFLIRYTHDGQSPLTYPSRADFIIFHCIRLTMLTTVYFYYQGRLATIKIDDIATNYFLSQKADRILAQKIIPKTPLFFRHVAAQTLSCASQARRMFSLHKSSLSVTCPEQQF